MIWQTPLTFPKWNLEIKHLHYKTTAQRHRPPKQESVPFSFVPLRFTKKILDDLHLSGREAALVGFVPRVR